MNAEVMKYILYVLRRFWIVVIFAAVFGGFTYSYFEGQDLIYRAESRVFIGGEGVLVNPSVNAINEGQRLAPTYAEFVELDSVLTATIDQLGLDMSTSRLASMISPRVIVDTSILVIRVTGSNPERVADIANEVARQLIITSPSNLSEEEQQQMSILQDQIAQLRTNIETVTEQSLRILGELNREVDLGRNPERIASLTTEYNQATDRETTVRNALTNTQDTFLSLSNRQNRLQIIEPATVPRYASNPNSIFIAAIVGLGGAGVAIGGLLLYFEYIDRKLRTEREINRILELPVIGIIKRSFRIGSRFNRGERTSGLPTMSIAEGYRTIQTNLLFTPPGTKPERLFIIASPKTNEGRSFTATNLATTVADSGLKVLLIDGDLRHPKLHEAFNLKNDKGLLSLSKESTIDEKTFESILDAYTQKTDVSSLDVITSGLDAKGDVLPAQIFGSESLKTFMTLLKRYRRYDVIFIDTSGALEVADSFMLSAATQANIVLLVRAAQTNQEQALKTRDQFRHIGGIIRGVILNGA